LKLSSSLFWVESLSIRINFGSGEQLSADAVVIATDGHTAAQLLQRRAPRSRAVSLPYFAADLPHLMNRYWC